MRTIINPIVKDKVTFLKTAKESNGKVTWLSIELAPNGGNTFHYHDQFTETFIGKEGILSLETVSEKFELCSEEEKCIPILALHRFYNASEFPIKFEVKIEPASRNFEEFLQIMYGLARDGKTNNQGIPTNLLHIGAISQLGETFPPKKSWLAKLSFIFRFLAKIADKTGKLEKLRQQYVRF